MEAKKPIKIMVCSLLLMVHNRLLQLGLMLRVGHMLLTPGIGLMLGVKISTSVTLREMASERHGTPFLKRSPMD